MIIIIMGMILIIMISDNENLINSIQVKNVTINKNRINLNTKFVTIVMMITIIAIIATQAGQPD